MIGDEAAHLGKALAELEKVLEDHYCPNEGTMGCLFCVSVEEAIRRIHQARRLHPGPLSQAIDAVHGSGVAEMIWRTNRNRGSGLDSDGL